MNKGGNAHHRSFYLQLRRIRDDRIRNLLRGIISRETERSISSSSVNLLRHAACGRNLAIAAELLLGYDGAFPFPNRSNTYQSLLKPHSLNELPPHEELTFTIGYLNGWAEEVQATIGLISELRHIVHARSKDALKSLLTLAEQCGASNFLAKKIAYIVSKDANRNDLSEELAKIAGLLNQSEYSVPFFSAMEAIDNEFPLINGTASRVQLVAKYVKDDFRQLLPLHNIAAVPVALADVGSYLRKASSMSLVDTIVAVQTIRHLSEQWPSLNATIDRHMSPALRAAFEHFSAVAFNERELFDDCHQEDADIVYYRRSCAFLEFARPAKYRSFVDRVLGPRFLRTISNLQPAIKDYKIPSRKDLNKALLGFVRADDYLNIQAGGKFLRTIYFLIFLQGARDLAALDQRDIRFIFEHTTGLAVLMTEHELERLYGTADEESKPLVTVLALALYKARSNNDDVDFKFRLNLSMTIEASFAASIPAFFNWLLPSTPEVANFLLSILDRPTLQKMYWLINNPDQADRVRQDILRLVGKQRERIEYYIEADSIEAQRQVSKLQKYFDDSRMYVDGFAMKTWLVENPTSYTQQYLRLIDPGDNVTTIKVKSVNNAQGAEIVVLASFDYVLFEIAKNAFHQFCTNTNFGIESYLGRRIRHNTLTGIMRGGVESILEKPQYQILTYDEQFMDAYLRWRDEYREMIEDMRREFLQFKTPQKPRGIFRSELNAEDEGTRTNLTVLRNMNQSARSSELFNDLLIRFCWTEIDPQLKAAAKYIGVELLNNAVSSMESLLGDFTDDAQKHFRHELRNAVHERFSRLSSWFRQPESGFVSANTRQLGDLIVIEAVERPDSRNPAISWIGANADLMMEGLSVHRMYDCLSVLIRNALMYGNPDAPIKVSVEGLTISQANIAQLIVSVTSTLTDGVEKSEHLARLEQSFKDDDLGASMVKEGYTGIKKVRYITQNSEGRATVSYALEGNDCTISFLLTVELGEVGNKEAA
ncbi:hypothetical protein [Rhizobium leguminosarum]|uniref:hypothetical protein n=1 Tax=Rhizobium leguminosarum TaxID=384 RepID=UPI00131A00B2|nr:hypothetical protein [Rhizobium leguminosarum]